MVTRTKLARLDGVRASPQVLSSALSMQWYVHTKKEKQSCAHPRLADARGEQRLPLVVQPYKSTIVGQTAENLNAGNDRKVSEHTMHGSLLGPGLQSCKWVRMPMLTPVYHRKLLLNGEVSIGDGPQRNRRGWSYLMNHNFFYINWTSWWTSWCFC